MRKELEGHKLDSSCKEPSGPPAAGTGQASLEECYHVSSSPLEGACSPAVLTETSGVAPSVH